MLNEVQVQKLRQTLYTSGWKDVMVPALKARANEAIKFLVLAPAERKGGAEGLDDATLRARIQDCEWMLVAFENEVQLFDLNRRRDELADGNGTEVPQGEPLREA